MTTELRPRLGYKNLEPHVFICIAHLTEEGAVDDFVPICCFCSKVRDDTNREVGKGPWVELTTYAISREVPLGHRLLFSHGYCPDCVAHFDERMAAYRRTTVWASLREAGRRLIAGADGELRISSGTVSASEGILPDREGASGAVH